MRILSRQSYFIIAVLISTARCDFAETARPKTSSDSTPYYLDLSDLKPEVYQVKDRPPKGLYILGKVQEGQFIPEGDVKGSESIELCKAEGWFELKTREFHGMQEARTPIRPYLEGTYRRNGFCPASRTVHY
jgi:hypothetical protein